MLSFRPVRSVIFVAAASFVLLLSRPAPEPINEVVLCGVHEVAREPAPTLQLLRWLSADLDLRSFYATPALAAAASSTPPPPALAPSAQRLGRLAVRRGVGHRLTRPA